MFNEIPHVTSVPSIQACLTQVQSVYTSCIVFADTFILCLQRYWLRYLIHISYLQRYITMRCPFLWSPWYYASKEKQIRPPIEITFHWSLSSHRAKRYRRTSTPCCTALSKCCHCCMQGYDDRLLQLHSPSQFTWIVFIHDHCLKHQHYGWRRIRVY